MASGAEMAVAAVFVIAAMATGIIIVEQVVRLRQRLGPTTRTAHVLDLGWDGNAVIPGFILFIPFCYGMGCGSTLQ